MLTLNSIWGSIEDGEGVAQAYKQAVKWYTKAAQQQFPSALNALGENLIAGQGIPQNKEAGLRLIEEAKKLGFTSED